MDAEIEILTCDQMRALEQAAIGSGAVTGLELMECAGQGVVAAMLDHWPAMARAPMRALVLCGPGNNGGDGYVVARLLAGRGWAVTVLGTDTRTPDAQEMRARWAGDVGALAPDLPPCDLVIDALFGTGGERALDGWSEVFAAIARAPRRVAIDIPSQIGADTGRNRLGADDAGPRADLTVTFHSAKPGHYLGHGPAASAALRIVDIGLARVAAADASGGDISAKKWGIARATPDVAVLRKAGGHKYGYGHALVLAGGPGHGGAARLAARGTLRVGAGLVTLACPRAALAGNVGAPDAVMLRAADDAEGLGQLLADARINALVLGPGLGLARARDLVPVALAAGRATVLDADAISAFAEAPRALFDTLHGGCVLTPHAGEFARLFPDLDLTDPLAAVRAAAARAGAVVLLKGPATVIAAPEGCLRINAAVYGDAAPWLATAGSGDVLAGIIAGLLARGLAPLDAAATGAWLHAAAARRFGPGLIADDLPDQIPAVFRDLGI